MSATLLERPPKSEAPKKDQTTEEGRLDWVSDPNLDAVLRDLMEIVSELSDEIQEVQAEVKRLRGFHPSKQGEAGASRSENPP